MALSTIKGFDVFYRLRYARKSFLEIEKLQLEKQQAFKESQSLKLVNAGFERFVRASKCILDLRKNLKIVNAKLGGGKEHQGLLQYLKLNADVVLNNDNALQELEEKIMLIQETSCLDAEAEKQQDFNTNHEKVDSEKEMEMEMEMGKELLQLVQSNAMLDMISHSSDDETQNLNVDPDPAPQKQQILPLRAGTKGFKYVEPVRKKADRENLKGIECKQCKKFYDAVLPDGGGKDSDKQNLRCEHHEGVSRHRYRYAPPSTPEGFGNIGFESEM
ncbi:hypothetical protein ACET3Z_006249 [Daucus carota]